jgi:hypothetical protein
MAGLGGCTGPTTTASTVGPAPAAVAVNPSATPPPTRDDKGHLVTLADLTNGNPTIGQNEGLADSTPGETAMEAAAASSSSPESSTDIDNLEIVGDGLKGKLAVLHVGANRNDSNLLSVFAGVKNETGRKLELEMQTLYRDKDGNSLNNGENWIPMTLKPHEQTQYRSVALTPDATDFLVRIRHAAPASAGP